MTQTAQPKISGFSPKAPCTVYIPDAALGWRPTTGCDEARDIFTHLDLLTFHEGEKTYSVMPQAPGQIDAPQPADPARDDRPSCRNWTLWGLHKGGWFAITAGATRMRNLEEDFHSALETCGWLELRIVPPTQAMPAKIADVPGLPLSI